MRIHLQKEFHHTILGTYPMYLHNQNCKTVTLVRGDVFCNGLERNRFSPQKRVFIGPYSLIDHEIDVGKNMGTYLNNHDKEFLHAIFEKKVGYDSFLSMS